MQILQRRLSHLLNSDKSKNLKKEKSSKNDDTPIIHKSENNGIAISGNNTTVKNRDEPIGTAVNNTIKVVD